jgi:hypothetical protein
MSDTEDLKDEDFDPGETEYEDESVSELQNIHATLERILERIPSTRPYSNSSEWPWLIVIIFLFSLWSGSKLDRWTDRAWYSITADASWQNVDIQKRPSDCDFMHAPIGGKSCHYKKGNYTFTNDDRRKLLQQATTQEERTRITNLPNSATVFWERKSE